MAHSDARQGKWRGNWRMEWVASTLHTTSEHGVSSITTADAHTSAASSRLNWRPCRFKRTRPLRRKTKSGFCACAITFQTQSTGLPVLNLSTRWRTKGPDHALTDLRTGKSSRYKFSRRLDRSQSPTDPFEKRSLALTGYRIPELAAHSLVIVPNQQSRLPMAEFRKMNFWTHKRVLLKSYSSLVYTFHGKKRKEKKTKNIKIQTQTINMKTRR